MTLGGVGGGGARRNNDGEAARPPAQEAGPESIKPLKQTVELSLYSGKGLWAEEPWKPVHILR